MPTAASSIGPPSPITDITAELKFFLCANIAVVHSRHGALGRGGLQGFVTLCRGDDWSLGLAQRERPGAWTRTCGCRDCRSVFYNLLNRDRNNQDLKFPSKRIHNCFVSFRVVGAGPDPRCSHPDSIISESSWKPWLSRVSGLRLSGV
jgi:hypothetical protein